MKYVSVVCATVVIFASQGVHVANVRLLKYSEQYLQLHIYLGIASKVQCWIKKLNSYSLGVGWEKFRQVLLPYIDNV